MKTNIVPTFHIEEPDGVKLYRQYNSDTRPPSTCDLVAFLERCMDRKCRISVIPADTHAQSSKVMDLKEITASVLDYMSRT